MEKVRHTLRYCAITGRFCVLLLFVLKDGMGGRGHVAIDGCEAHVMAVAAQNYKRNMQ